MKVSEITVDDLVFYLRLNEDDVGEKDRMLLSQILGSAKQFLVSYTGLNLSECDKFEDFVSAVYILCEDMFDNRSFYVDKTYVNKVVQSILDMHSVNYI
ncbi:MAG: head-tail connector protein [Oscillospiraceae bacterium]|jgi:hypothetical protein|nr:head-tail connector protein [Oscillospiraceae bacterium]